MGAQNYPCRPCPTRWKQEMSAERETSSLRAAHHILEDVLELAHTCRVVIPHLLEPVEKQLARLGRCHVARCCLLPSALRRAP